MKTPWGELRIADAHVHLFSWNFFRLLTNGRDPAAVCAELGWVEPPERPDLLAAMWVAELHQHGVERCAMFASLPGDEPSVAAAVGAYPERFWGGFFLNPTSAGAVERLRPKMMTVAAITAGLLPLLWRQGSGAEIMRHIAAPMIGGMLSSTLLTLLVIPLLYALLKGRGLPEGGRSA